MHAKTMLTIPHNILVLTNKEVGVMVVTTIIMILVTISRSMVTMGDLLAINMLREVTTIIITMVDIMVISLSHI